MIVACMLVLDVQLAFVCASHFSPVPSIICRLDRCLHAGFGCAIYFWLCMSFFSC
uniref:Uncharacterized protein n=1 Tax=Manihot esculenta TaxID=3983 RepID=A0A2C9U3T6_MANES